MLAPILSFHLQKFQIFRCFFFNHSPAPRIPKSPKFPQRHQPLLPVRACSCGPQFNPPATKISRFARIDAQNALFDYLHSTRNLHFTDAEHTSKNCPEFLQKLVSKVDSCAGGGSGGDEVGRLLTRFLRFNPINEFEPFFESIGLNSSELPSFLPKNLFFLKDDERLLENYHVLCNYGIPRSRIGKFYKEADKIFKYEDGILLSKLRAYEELGLSRPTIIKLVTCCPDLLIGDINLDFLHALQIFRRLGVQLDLLRGSFSDKNKYNWRRISEMLEFLDRMSPGKKDLVTLISKHPRFVFDDSGRKIYVLVAMLLKLGLKMDVILNVFLNHPQILAGNFTRNLWKSVHFLSEIGMQNEDIAKIVATHPEVLGSCFCKKPSSVMESLNISPEGLCEIIIADPSQFHILVSRRKALSTLPKSQTNYIQEKTSFLLKLGFVENSDEMAQALNKFRGRGDQMQERFDCLVNAGMDYHTVAEMIKLVPPILNQSSDVIQIKLDYLLNELGYPVAALAVFPTYLCYNMDKIKLRFSMFNWLKGHGIVVPTKIRKIPLSKAALSTILACSDARFEKYFVKLHPEGPITWERMKKDILGSKQC